MVERNLSKKRLMLEQKLAYSCNQSYVECISTFYLVNDLQTLLWQSY